MDIRRVARILWPVPALAAQLWLAGCASPQSAAEARGAIRAELEAYYADFSDRDWEAFASHFWPGADITTTWQPPGEDSVRVVPTPVAEFVAQAPMGPGSREIFEERMLHAEINVFGNLAQAWVRYRARFGDPGDVSHWEGIDAFSFLRVGGDWKIASLVFAADPGGPGPAEP